MDDRSQGHGEAGDGFPPPLTEERLNRARAKVAAIRATVERRGVDMSQLPDPVDELSKARVAGGWD